jgi:DNA replication protein DnaC
VERILDIEEQPATCPRCNGPSRAIRYAPPPGLSESVRKRIDPERPFIAQHCVECKQRIAEEEAAAERQRAAEAHQRRCLEALSQIETPPMYLQASLANFELHGESADWQKLERSLGYARSMVASWPKVPMISVFAGGCGTGKGHLAWAIARELAATQAVTGRVAVLSDVIRDLREAWNSSRDTASESERLRKYRAPDLLVIDEISRHAFFGQPQQHLYDLVAYREVRLKPTILTTNERGDDLAEVLGPALSSRAAGWDGFVDFGESDWRFTRGHRRRAS